MKTNDSGLTQDQMFEKYPDSSDYSKVFSNKHFHWVKDGVCQICKTTMVAEFQLADKKVVDKKRKCKSCKNKLPKSRWAHCTTCVPEMDADDGELVYHQLAGREEDDVI